MAMTSFYMVETGAPMDTLVCRDCLPGVEAVKVVSLNLGDLRAIAEQEDMAGCDMCGRSFPSVAFTASGEQDDARR